MPTPHIQPNDFGLLERLQANADEHHDGVLTICRCKNDWRIGFELPVDGDEIEHDFCVGLTFREAAKAALGDGSDD
jgi:hypothetical protein